MGAESISHRLAEARILAVVTVDRPDDAVPLGKALDEGGVGAVEIALRTPAALEAISAMRSAFPKFLLGAGTVLRCAQADAVKECGVDFALAPGFDAETVKHCAAIGLPFVPGVATASEVQAAIIAGCRTLKFFPAESLGGMRGLRTLAAPFNHLGVQFVPLGGVNLRKVAHFLAEPHVVAVGGSWIASPNLIRKRAWDRIRQNALEATVEAAGAEFTA